MLRRFLYLNSEAVDSYLGVVEGGLTDSSRRRETIRGTGGANARLGTSNLGAGISRERESSDEHERTIHETPEQRFDRLVTALAADPDRFGYEDVVDLGDAFNRCGIGTMVSVDCDIEVPQAVRLFAQPEQLDDMLGMLDVIRPLAGMFGLDDDTLPSESQTQAVRSLASTLRFDLVFVGEVDENAPRIAGKLERTHLRELPEGEATVVGKVARRWAAGDSHPLLGLPGASLMSRKQRRASSPVTGLDDDSILRGPALTLDVLAVFR